MANFFTNLVSAGASGLVEAIGTAIDKNVTSDEERKALDNEIAKAKLQYELESAKLGLEETKAYLADTNSARVNQTQVQASEHASWLAKNVHPILALGIIGLTFGMYGWIINMDARQFAEHGMKEIIIYILGALTTVSTQVAAYFFGSSQGSADKNKALERLAKDQSR